MRAITAGLLAAACAVALSGSIPAASAHAKPPAAKDAAGEPSWVGELRAALERFQDPTVAERHGYTPTDVCKQFPFTGPDGQPLGAMGYHYVNKQLAADPKLDPARPEILVYVPDGKGGRVLGAVEYLRYDADGLLSTTEDRPRLFGQDFDGPFPPLENGMPAHYSLHVWLFKHNPKGPYEPWNPDVRCPETTTAQPPRPAVKPAKPAKVKQAEVKPAEKVRTRKTRARGRL